MFKRHFNVKVRDKLTKQEYGVSLSGRFDPESAKAHVAGLPGSHGGAHPGLEVLGVEEVDANGKPLPVESAEVIADVVVNAAVPATPAHTTSLPAQE